MMMLKHVSAAQMLSICEMLAGQIRRFEQVLDTLPPEDMDAPEVLDLRRDIERRRAQLQVLEMAVPQQVGPLTDPAWVV
jgi:hypothetical protein